MFREFPVTIGLVTEAILERMRPLWDAADRALRTDSSYVIEVAQASSTLKARLDAKADPAPSPGV